MSALVKHVPNLTDEERKEINEWARKSRAAFMSRTDEKAIVTRKAMASMRQAYLAKTASKRDI
jgi:hypothetical protein